MARATRSSKRLKQEEEEEEEEEEEDDEPVRKSAAKTKKKPAAAKKAPAPKKSKQQQEDDDDEEEGEEEEDRGAGGGPELNNAQGTAKLCVGPDGTTQCDAMLVFVDRTSDKYYVLQAIELAPNSKYVCYSRWGRTGSKGQTQSTACGASLAKCVKEFEKKFLDKTGQAWSVFTSGQFKQKAKKYDCLASPVAEQVRLARQAGVNWEYEVQDNVAGKQNGWYAYDADNATEVEAVFQSWKNAQSKASLAKRTITSDSSGFTYKVDLDNLVQENASTGKQRRIRRVNPNNYVACGKQTSTNKVKPPAIALPDLEQLFGLPSGVLLPSPPAEADAKLIEQYAELTTDHFDGGEHGFRGAFQYASAAAPPPAASSNRKLLWCGLKTRDQVSQALREGVVPLTQGRAGLGVYASYTLSQAASRVAHGQIKPQGTGVLLLIEVDCGQRGELVLEQDQPQLSQAALSATGHDSVLLQGRVQPDELVQHTLLHDGDGGKQQVLLVPASKPVPHVSSSSSSSFAETEVVVYDASLARIRFAVALQWPSEIELVKPPVATAAAVAPVAPAAPKEDEDDEDYEQEDDDDEDDE